MIKSYRGMTIGDARLLINSIPDLEFAWLCGILEGEGWFTTSKGTLEIGIESTDLDVVERVRDSLKLHTKIYTTSKKKATHKEKYGVKVFGRLSYALMERLYPNMSARRKERIADLLTFTWRSDD